MAYSCRCPDDSEAYDHVMMQARQQEEELYTECPARLETLRELDSQYGSQIPLEAMRQLPPAPRPPLAAYHEHMMAARRQEEELYTECPARLDTLRELEREHGSNIPLEHMRHLPPATRPMPQPQRGRSRIPQMTGPRAAHPAPPRSRIPQPGGSHAPQKCKCGPPAGSGSTTKIPCPSRSGSKIPGASRIPSATRIPCASRIPGASRIPHAGGSRIPQMGGSRVPQAGGSRIARATAPRHAGGSRIPQTGQSRKPAKQKCVCDPAPSRSETRIHGSRRAPARPAYRRPGPETGAVPRTNLPRRAPCRKPPPRQELPPVTWDPYREEKSRYPTDFGIPRPPPLRQPVLPLRPRRPVIHPYQPSPTIREICTADETWNEMMVRSENAPLLADEAFDYPESPSQMIRWNEMVDEAAEYPAIFDESMCECPESPPHLDGHPSSFDESMCACPPEH